MLAFNSLRSIVDRGREVIVEKKVRMQAVKPHAAEQGTLEPQHHQYLLFFFYCLTELTKMRQNLNTNSKTLEGDPEVVH